MVTINIRQPANYNAQMGCFCKPISTLPEAVKKSLKPQERLTAEKAVKILRKIEIKSKIQSFITKPVVAISLAAAGTIAGYICAALATFSIALSIFGLVLGLGSSIALGMAIRFACDGSLNKMSNAYAQRAQNARDLINQINEAKRAGNQVEIRV